MEKRQIQFKNAVKLTALSLLNEMYGITEHDFMRAEIEFVPAVILSFTLLVWEMYHNFLLLAIFCKGAMRFSTSAA